MKNRVDLSPTQRINNKSTYVENLAVFSAIEQIIYPYTQNLNLKNIAIVCVQHELATTINLLASLISLSANPKNIFLLGKLYSTCHAVSKVIKKLGIRQQEFTMPKYPGHYSTCFKQDVNQMWSTVSTHINKTKTIQSLIVLDDGGQCLASVPQGLIDQLPIIGIEQTTGGLIVLENTTPKFPIIEVASTAAKLFLESPIIAEAAIKPCVEKVLSGQKNAICGIIGFGSIGKALTKKLTTMGYSVIVYEKNQQKLSAHRNFEIAGNIKSLIQRADYIFSCTGRDVTKEFKLTDINGRKVLASCASEDREFLSLLLELRENGTDTQQYHPLKDIDYADTNRQITILRGGFPITFDGSSQPAPAHDIQLTQGLLLGAVLQASLYLSTFKTRTQRIMLDPDIQTLVASSWIQTRPHDDISWQLSKKFMNKAWIMENSGGCYQSTSMKVSVNPIKLTAIQKILVTPNLYSRLLNLGQALTLFIIKFFSFNKLRNFIAQKKTRILFKT